MLAPPEPSKYHTPWVAERWAKHQKPTRYAKWPKEQSIKTFIEWMHSKPHEYVTDPYSAQQRNRFTRDAQLQLSKYGYTLAAVPKVFSFDFDGVALRLPAPHEVDTELPQRWAVVDRFFAEWWAGLESRWPNGGFNRLNPFPQYIRVTPTTAWKATYSRFHKQYPHASYVRPHHLVIPDVKVIYRPHDYQSPEELRLRGKFKIPRRS